MVPRTSYALELPDICNTWMDDTRATNASWSARQMQSWRANVTQMLCECYADVVQMRRASYARHSGSKCDVKRASRARHRCITRIAPDVRSALNSMLGYFWSVLYLELRSQMVGFCTKDLGRRDKTTILYCSTFLCTFWWGILTQIEKLATKHIRLATNIKFAGVDIYGHPNIWCEDQHRLTTKKFFYLELKRNRQFYRVSAEKSQPVFPRPLSQTNTTMKKLLH
jgi:hypothetical protein